MFGQETPAQNFVKKKKNLQTKNLSNYTIMKENIYIQLLPKNPQKWPFIAIYSQKMAKNGQ